MIKILKYNLIILALLVVVIELSTRTISWVSGKGFFLGLEELEAWDKSVASLYAWHPFTGFRFSENVAFRGGAPGQINRSSVQTDEHGFLSDGEPLDYLKGENEIRIATIGGSTTANIGLDFDKNWPGRIGELIQQAHPDKKITIINAGTPGFDTSQSIGNLALRVMPFEPDVVIIYHAYNDLKAIGENTSFKPDYSHFHNRPHGYHEQPGIIERLLNESMFYVRMKNRKRAQDEKIAESEVLKALNGEGNRIDVVPAIARQTFDQHMRSMIGIARAGGAEVVLSTFATLHDPNLDYTKEESFAAQSDFQKNSFFYLLHFTPGLTVNGIFSGINQYNELIAEIANEEKIPLVDAGRLVPHSRTYFIDRVHFSEAGAERMAQSFYPAVEMVLKNKGLVE
jgi:lysophospholipase L1-like esterase